MCLRPLFQGVYIGRIGFSSWGICSAMDTADSVSQWIAGAKSGDEQATQQLWERYFSKLVRLCRGKLGEHLRRAADEEDVAVSAFASFCAAAQAGRFPKLNERGELWGLLVKIAACKVADQIQHDRRQKRGGGRVRGESIFGGRKKDDTGRGIEQVVGEEPSPELAAALTEEYERLLTLLDDTTLRGVAEMKLAALTNEEIAEQLDCSLRTVERKLWVIRKKWSSEETSDESGAS